MTYPRLQCQWQSRDLNAGNQAPRPVPHVSLFLILGLRAKSHSTEGSGARQVLKYQNGLLQILHHCQYLGLHLPSPKALLLPLNSTFLVDLIRWGPFKGIQSQNQKNKRKSPGLPPGSVVVPGEQGRGLKGVPDGRHMQLSPCGVGFGLSGANTELHLPCLRLLSLGAGSHLPHQL